MQIELLRDIINSALEWDNEETRFDTFYVFCNDYEDCYPLFIEIFENKKIEEIGNEECTIKRFKDGFLVIDSNGNRDTFTYYEISVYVDFWKKLDQQCPLPDSNAHIRKILQSVSILYVSKEKDVE